jgi:hypothetical protein
MTPVYTQHGVREQIEMTRAPFNQWRAPDGALWAQFYREPDSYLVRFPRLVDFQLSADGTEVHGWPAPGVQPGTVQHLYLNQALPLALSRQGKLVLHASAVVVDGAVLAFVGDSGRGKSTLAASFATQGARFLTDDGLLLECSDGQLIAFPSHPSIRLWEDSQLAVLGKDAPGFPAVEYTHKARFVASSRIAFCGEPRPLRCTYYLGSASAAAITIARMRPAAALLELVRNSFLLDIGEQEMLASHFSAISDIANGSSNYQLDFPRRYEELNALREAIIAHATERDQPHDLARERHHRA